LVVLFPLYDFQLSEAALAALPGLLIFSFSGLGWN
jgi:hypothetical protein